MESNNPKLWQRLALSTLVVVSFGVMALQKRNQQTGSFIIFPSPSPTATDHLSHLESATPSPQEGSYKNGQYVGNITDAFYGDLQVSITVGNGRITKVDFLKYPEDRRTSIEINQRALPLLESETIQAQSAEVDYVTGATQTSQAYIESLRSALNRATL